MALDAEEKKANVERADQERLRRQKEAQALHGH